MKEVHKELGSIIREYRTRSNFTQLELSQMLGYDTTQFVSLFERGLSKVPLNTLGKLIVILGIPERKITESLVRAYRENLLNEISLGKKVAQKA
ncbi:MAG TPA: helix-turn-helix transcriptional regulator [Pseudobdellovibrionaceae bacterium]|nr:helix-turn-helix transcriptional regulator [Pseudobdellovibrionaceae bacterium]